jgi:glutathione S-transferase
MLKIYGLYTPNLLKVQWAAEELGLNYEHVKTDLTKGETRTPEHFARHPFGKVPVIEHDGRFLFESNAIVRYLAGMTESSLFPSEPWARGQVDQWSEYFAHHAGKAAFGIFFEENIAKQFFNREPDAAFVEETTKNLDEQLPVLEKHFATNTYAAGDDFTVADIIGGVFMGRWEDTSLKNWNEKFPNICKWLNTITSRDGYKKTLAANNPS